MKLRGYQNDAVNAVRDSYLSGHRAPLLVLPTGGGKTIVFTHIAKESSAMGKKVLILVHRVELLKQTISKLRMFGIRCGAISPKYTPDYTADIQVAMVQTMNKRLMYYQHFDLIITDEAHHVVANNYMKVINYYPQAFQLGVTATPIRADGRGLGKTAGGVYDDLIIGPTVAELIAMDFLVEPIVYASREVLDLTGVKRSRNGDYNKKDLSDTMNKPKITGSAVAHYADICPGDPGVAFCTSVKHAEETAKEFRNAGFKFYGLHGKTDPDVRDKLIAALGDGSIHGLASCDVISEGTDIPSIAVAMLLRPTESLGLYLQQVGRALRPSEGKPNAIVLDHAGNTYRHGFVDQDRDWSLAGKKKKKNDCINLPSVAQCGECFAVYVATQRACPQCGAIRQINVVSREPEKVEGTLQQLTKEDKLRIRRDNAMEQRKATTIEELELIAQKRGYKPGWAKHIFNARQKKN